jgi:RNA polymerase sigma factor (sigma-70 family)
MNASELIERHIPLVEFHLKRFAALGELDLDNLRSAGLLALVRAEKEWRAGCREASFRTYASHCVRGAILNEHEKMGQSREFPTGDFLDSVSPTASTSDEECRAAVAGAGLDEREQFVVKSVFYERLTLEETASMLGISAERVRQLKARAMEKIRRRMKAEGRSEGEINPPDGGKGGTDEREG